MSSVAEYHNHLGQPVGFPIQDWQERPRLPRSPLTGMHCQVEPLDVNVHAESLFQSFAEDKDQKNWTYLGYGPFDRYGDFRAWRMADCTGDDPLFHAIVDLKTGEAVGLASYLRIEPKVGVIEVGHIHYSPRLQKTPMATEAMYLMMQRVFDELGYRRYEWKCDALNESSRTAARRLGFSYEGLFRQATIYRGRNRDTAWYSVIDQEWPLLKQAYQTWLSPANFDDQGQQSKGLSALINEARNREAE